MQLSPGAVQDILADRHEGDKPLRLQILGTCNFDGILPVVTLSTVLC